MNAAVKPMAPEELRQRIIEFAQGASMEISTPDEETIPQLAQTLPPGSTVYIAHTPKATLDDVVRVAIKVQQAGLRASPHIVARRIASETALRDALRRVHEAGVEQILLIAGDLTPPAGNFTSTLEILDSGATVDAGIRILGVAGHPEGNSAIPEPTLWTALQHKQAFAERTGSKMHITTQFGFDPDAMCLWDRQLVAHGITLPVHLGVAGPTPLPKLLKYAKHCGVGASLGAMMKNMNVLRRVTGLAASTDEMFIGLIRACAARGATQIVKPHLYAFGGVLATARWLRAVMDGAFDLRPDGDKFTVRG